MFRGINEDAGAPYHNYLPCITTVLGLATLALTFAVTVTVTVRLSCWRRSGCHCCVQALARLFMRQLLLHLVVATRGGSMNGRRDSGGSRRGGRNILRRMVFLEETLMWKVGGSVSLATYRTMPP